MDEKLNIDLLNYFLENVSRFSLEQLQQKALSSGYHQEEISKVIEHISKGNSSLIKEEANQKIVKKSFSWFLFSAIILVVIGGIVFAGFFFFSSSDKGSNEAVQEIPLNNLPAGILPSLINQSEIPLLLSKNAIPNSYYSKSVLETEATRPMDFEVHSKKFENLLKMALLVGDSSKKEYLFEGAMHALLSQENKVKEFTYYVGCSIGICSDSAEFMNDKISSSSPLNDFDYLYENSSFLGIKDTIGFDSFCFLIYFPLEVQKKSGKEEVLQKKIICKHPEYNIVTYSYSYEDKKNNLFEAEITMEELKIDIPINEDLFEINTEESGKIGMIDLKGLEEFANSLKELIENKK